MRPVLFSVLLVLLSQLGPAQAKPSPLEAAAANFLNACSAGDEAAMKAIAHAGDPDPFQVAGILLIRHAERKLERGKGPGPFLAAAEKLAELAAAKKENRGLPALVEAWKGYSDEALAHEISAFRKLVRLHVALNAGKLRGDLSTLANVGRLIKKAPKESLNAIGLCRIACQVFLENNRPRRADRFRAEAARRAGAVAWLRVQAQTLGWTIYFWRGRPYREALADLEQALAIWKAIDNPVEVAWTRDSIGILHLVLGDPETALKCHRQARAEFVRLHEPLGAMGTLTHIAEVHMHRGEFAKALEFHLQVKKELKTIGDDLSRASNLGAIGSCYDCLGLPEKAIPYLEEALALSRKLKHHRRVSTVLGNLAVVYGRVGQFGKNLTLAREALALKRAVGNRYGVLQSLNSVGAALMMLGRYPEALDTLERALEECREIGDLPRTGIILENIGMVYYKCGRMDRAAEYFRKAIARYSQDRRRSSAARIRVDLGSVHRRQGDLDQAMNCYRRSLEDYNELDNESEALGVRIKIAIVHGLEGDLDKAIEINESVLAESEARGLQYQASTALQNLGAAWEKKGEFRKALDYAARALRRAEAMGDPENTSRILALMARGHLENADPSAAVRLARRAIEMRSHLGQGLAEESTISIRETAGSIADLGLCAALALVNEEPETAYREAFRLVEGGRGLLLTEGLINRRALLESNLPPEILVPLSRARARVRRLLEKAMKPPGSGGEDTARPSAARKKLDAAYEAYQQCIDRTQREQRRVAEIVYPQPIPLEAYRGSLAPSEVLVHYQMTEEKVIALVVSRTQTRLADLGNTEAVVRSVEDYQSFLADPESTEEAAGAVALYEKLIRPLEPVLIRKSRLLISPVGILTFLPFEALVRQEKARGERVVERWDVSYVPSGTVHAALVREQGGSMSGRGFVGLGDPVYPGEDPSGNAGPAACRELGLRGVKSVRRLVESGVEVRTIAALYPEEGRLVLLRERATREELVGALKAHRGRIGAVHLACHGIIDTAHPNLTGLVLGGGEMLTLDDLYQQTLSADIVVLSACDTGRGRIRSGEGVIGLVRGVFFAGCPRVVVSNWKVHDASTRRLMVSFYEKMVKKRLSPAAALRSAKLDMLRSEAHAHPFHWAAFVLWGLGD